jgi:hypothetical protein
MRYAKIVNNKVVQISCDAEDGFVAVDKSVVCGMVLDNGVFKTVVPDISIDVVRAKRNTLLLESDMWMISDFPTGAATEQQILDYRQALRDFPATVNLSGVKNINNVTFPTKPF